MKIIGPGLVPFYSMHTTCTLCCPTALHALGVIQFPTITELNSHVSTMPLSISVKVGSVCENPIYDTI